MEYILQLKIENMKNKNLLKFKTPYGYLYIDKTKEEVIQENQEYINFGGNMLCLMYFKENLSNGIGINIF